MPFGLRDIPLEKVDDEVLGIKEYAKSLSDFIQQCETPLTIALQGDWGSGKTSLMNLIKNSLPVNRIETLWINTWQYAQFGMQDELAISLLSHVSGKLGADETLKKVVWNLGNRAAKILPSIGGLLGGSIAKEGIEKITNMLNSEEKDSAEQILELKDGISKSVTNRLEKTGKDRIVIFIDDLDRLLPEKAVELLEVLKLFLDVPSCVFVLACDYQVVSQGLSRKFGVGSDALKGKSFFDKIIQLPFSMPLGQYDVINYIESLLRKIGIEYEQDDAISYADMVHYSIGFNPRSMKRLFNSLLLLNLVAEEKKLFDDNGAGARRGEKQRIMFGCLCLQTAYEPIYKYMQKNADKIDQQFFEVFENETTLNNNNRLTESIKELIQKDESAIRTLSQFMEIFYDSIQLKSDSDRKSLSDKEIETLRQVLRFSSITSTDASAATRDSKFFDERYANREMGKEFAGELNVNYADILQKLGAESFRIYQARNATAVAVYLWSSVNDIRFSHEFYFDSTHMGYYSAASNKALREDSKRWFENIIASHPKYFSQPIFNTEEYMFATLWRVDFSPELDRTYMVKRYKEEVIKTLDIVLPKLLETKESAP